MEELKKEIEELKRKTEIHKMILFVILKETGLLDKVIGQELEKKPKDKSNQEVKGDFLNILNGFDADKAMKN